MVNLTAFSFLLFWLLPIASTQAKNVDESVLIDSVYGLYEVHLIERYRGGLTTREEAFLRQDSRISVQEDVFTFWNDDVCENPHYAIENHYVNEIEGEVSSSSERYGNFYGYGEDRNVINELSVACHENDDATYSFEIVNGELWLFLDGWFYQLQRTAVR
ncbi:MULTISPECIES: hypothetical protein [unclassified Halomonas]|uniref:hypothetical protein n=1 Tax=unclassified Halomonas TaxID=2609666 RepID=UPI00209CFD9B|nr:MULTISPECIES: hypothetical protein [unclassified Halomonas]MCP1316006.1 hypothetical protein [Halomonas sp. 707D7]MCP1328207.1 hypothetical protein [Halomonas sp. 707D4]